MFGFRKNIDAQYVLDLIERGEWGKISELIEKNEINLSYSENFKNNDMVCKLIEALPNSNEMIASAIMKKVSVKDAYEFALNVKGAPINDLAQAIIDTKNPEYIYLFAKDVPNAPIEKLSDGFLNAKFPYFAGRRLDYSAGKDIYLFAKDIPGAPIEKLVEKLKATASPKYIYLQEIYQMHQ